MANKMKHDWSLLPYDVVEAIAKKVTSLADYLRFRAVCHLWRSAASPQHLPPQIPWLMPVFDIESNDDSARSFYDLSALKIHILNLPEMRGAKVCGSSHGWLVLLKGQVLSLLNPITHATIPLPPVTAPPAIIEIDSTDAPDNEKWDVEKYALRPTDIFGVSKAILTSSPLDHSCLVVITATRPLNMAFCKIGDERWTVMEDLPWYDLAYSNGCLYTIRLYGVAVYDLSKPSQVMLNDSFGNAAYLVDGVSGDILLITQRKSSSHGVLRSDIVYDVYQLICNDEEPQWIRMCDIGHHVLFPGSYGSEILFSTTNIQFPEWCTNCLFCYSIQVTNKRNQQQSSGFWSEQSLKLVRLDDGTVTDITGNLKSMQNNIHWQQSVWLTPSLL